MTVNPSVEADWDHKTAASVASFPARDVPQPASWHLFTLLHECHTINVFWLCDAQLHMTVDMRMQNDYSLKY